MQTRILTRSDAALAADVIAEAATIASSTLEVWATFLETFTVPGQLRLAWACRMVDIGSVTAAVWRRLCWPITDLAVRWHITNVCTASIIGLTSRAPFIAIKIVLLREKWGVAIFSWLHFDPLFLPNEKMEKLNFVRGEHKPSRCWWFATMTLRLTPRP